MDDNLNIHILDAIKIMIYDFNGNHINTIKLKAKTDGINIVPQQLIVLKDGGYGLWEASNPRFAGKNKFFFNQIDKDQDIIDTLFKMNRPERWNMHRFTKYNNSINIIPPYGVYQIYSINNNEISLKYNLLFQDRAIKEKIPEWGKMTQFKKEMEDRKYVTKIVTFVETDDWIFFQFYYLNNRYNSFYSKRMKKSFVYLPKRTDKPNESLFWKFDYSCRDKMYSLVEPTYLLEKLKYMNTDILKSKYSNSDIKIKNQLENVSLTDNPILLICSLKKY